MDKNTWIGFLLIAAIIVGFNIINRPSEEEIAELARILGGAEITSTVMQSAAEMKELAKRTK